MWSEGASVAFDLSANGDPKVGRAAFEAFGPHTKRNPTTAVAAKVAGARAATATTTAAAMAADMGPY